MAYHAFIATPSGIRTLMKDQPNRRMICFKVLSPGDAIFMCMDVQTQRKIVTIQV